MNVRIFALAALTCLAACADESRAPPVSTDPLGGSGKGPVDPNSLPLGSAVDAPLDPRAGNLDTIRVGPRAPVR